jgi:hypothetical protein
MAYLTLLLRWATATLAAKGLEDRSDAASHSRALAREGRAAQACAARLGHRHTAHTARMIVDLNPFGDKGTCPCAPDDTLVL